MASALYSCGAQQTQARSFHVFGSREKVAAPHLRERSPARRFAPPQAQGRCGPQMSLISPYSCGLIAWTHHFLLTQPCSPLAPVEHRVEAVGEGLASALCLPVPRCWEPGKKLISEGWFMLGSEDNPMCSAWSLITSTSLKSCYMARADPKLGKQANPIKSEGKRALVHFCFCEMKVALCSNTTSCHAPAEDMSPLDAFWYLARSPERTTQGPRADSVQLSQGVHIKGSLAKSWPLQTQLLSHSPSYQQYPPLFLWGQSLRHPSPRRRTEIMLGWHQAPDRWKRISEATHLTSKLLV